MELVQSIEQLYIGIHNLCRVFHEIRKYRQLELHSDEYTLELPIPSLKQFIEWICKHTKPIMDSLCISGLTQDLKKLIYARFLLGGLPFQTKGVGVRQLRVLLETIDKESKKHIVKIQHMSRTLLLPQESEITIVYMKSLTSDTKKELDKFQKTHPRIIFTELSLIDHLKCFLLQHKQMPHTLIKLTQEEIQKVRPKPPLEFNELSRQDIQVQLVGAIQGDVIKSIIALKTGVNMTQYWKII